MELLEMGEVVEVVHHLIMEQQIQVVEVLLNLVLCLQEVPADRESL